uniref:OSJNBa0022F16.4 protein n=1 Tax=Oryza sativa subsp. japonica TaxID=39947 RepID=Q7F9K7_ORYSJ|nr:OSJNBa0022F16.4 [Oryza sativa Japonica Group]
MSLRNTNRGENYTRTSKLSAAAHPTPNSLCSVMGLGPPDGEIIWQTPSTKGPISGREVKSAETNWGAIATAWPSRWRLAEGNVTAPPAPEAFAVASCNAWSEATALAEVLPPVGASASLAGSGDRSLFCGGGCRGADEVGIPSEDVSLSEKPPATCTTPFFFLWAAAPAFDDEPVMVSNALALAMF